ncbi:MAG TPA: Fe2+-dependent dioxygenase [Alphaproteobacteria bacterium]
MLVVIPDILSAAEIKKIREELTPEDFLDGALTAGGRAKAVKKNLQTDRKSDRMSDIQQTILAALDRNPIFRTVAAPRKIIPPRFNLYKQGMFYGDHVDNAIMGDADDPIRVDCSFTLFMNDPSEYEGGELVVKSGYGVSTFKLPAGHMIVYPTYSFHEVRPVTKGERLACISWLQSLVRDATLREILLDLAIVSQMVESGGPNAVRPALDTLDKVRKNLLRQWSET